MSKRGLNRGLNDLGVGALLSDIQAKHDNQLKYVTTDKLSPGQYQPRMIINQDTLIELSESIKAHGVIQPLVVRSIGINKYEIIAGERRWRAARLAGVKKIPVVVKDITEKSAMAISLIENIQREDLNVIEEAIALQRLIDEFNMTHQEVADSVGKSRSNISNLLRLLQLSSEIKTLIENGKIEMGHARALLSLNREEQLNAAKIIVASGLSVRETEDLVRKINSKSKIEDNNIKSVSPCVDNSKIVDRYVERLLDKIKSKVSIKQSKNGSGMIMIKYKNLDKLDEIVKLIES